jgi:hypothetical protein
MIKNFKIFESLENKRFEVGDIVTHKDHPEFGLGEVKVIEEPRVFIEWENPSRGEEHFLIKKGHGWMTSHNGIKCYNFYGGKKMKKILNPEVDPYGEEDWGYEEIKNNESVEKTNKKTFNFGDKVKLIDLDGLLMDTARGFLHGEIQGLRIGDIGVVNKFTYNIIYVSFNRVKEDLWCNSNNFEKYGSSERVFSDVDPYGEEDWTNESLEPKDIKINVQNNEQHLVNNLIEKMSIITQKRVKRNLRIVSIKGYIDDEHLFDRRKTYSTKFELLMSNRDCVVGEYNSRDNNIKIMVNDEVIFDIDHKSYDKEVLIDRISNEYKKYLENKKFKLRN